MVEVRKINLQDDGPVIEAYIGEYASGKSENAINRAVGLAAQNRKVTLVDLDFVEPFYTLRPLKTKLKKEKGIEVIAWETKDTIGLGEAGSLMQPAMKWVLRRSGDIIMDIGYGVEGAKTMNLVEGARQNPDLKIYLVINIARPMTATEQDIIDHANSLGRVDGLINNSHLGDETDVNIIQDGAKLVTTAARKLGIPVLATSVAVDFFAKIGNLDCMGNPVRVLDRYMPEAFW